MTLQSIPQGRPLSPDETAALPLDTIVCADALEFLATLPDASVDMVLTSPPYDNLRKYGGFTWDFEGIACQLYRVVKPGGVVVWVVGDAFIDGSETLTSFKQALYLKEAVGFNMHQRMVWVKEGVPRKRPSAYFPDFEDMYVFSKGTPIVFNPMMRPNKKAGQIQRKTSAGKNGFTYSNGFYTIAASSMMTNVWTINVGNTGSDKYSFEHPAPFPEKLATLHILTWTNPGAIVLDCFMGSGTTAKIARNLDRRYIGSELNPDYVQLARRRLAQPWQPMLLEFA